MTNEHHLQDMVSCSGETNMLIDKEVLFLHAKRGNVAGVLDFFKQGVDPNTSHNGRNLLIAAAENGHTELVRTLINHEVDLDVQDWHGSTALMHASNRSYEKIVKILINEGASVNIQDNDKWTALMHVARRGREKVAQILLEGNATIDMRDNDGMTALMHASYCGHEAVVQNLIDAGANLDAQDKLGRTSLMRACSCGHVALVLIFIDAKANLNLESSQRKTALRCAAEYLTVRSETALSIIRELLDAGANVLVKDSEGMSFIDHAPEEYQKQLQQLVDSCDLLRGYHIGQLK